MKMTLKQKLKMKKRSKMLIYGLKHRLIFPYPKELFDRLRPYSLGGLPASIILFINELCNGKCYDRAELMSLALNDCKIVHANIDSLRINYPEHLCEHAFVETSEFGGNKEWVIDTSMGLIYDKNYYYKMENPTINKVLSKEDVLSFLQTKQIIATNFDEDKYALPMYLPFVEAALNNSNDIMTVMYKEKIKEELELFKKTIGYDLILKEVEEDIKLMRTNPKKLDEKFQIVKDRYGRVVSRMGKQNPYYVSPEEVDRRDAELKEIENDEEKKKEFFSKLFIETKTQMDLEFEEYSKLALERLEEIEKNPTKNFYEDYPYKR